MTTYDDLIGEITSNLQGFTVLPDKVTALAVAVDAAETTLQVDDASQVGRGMVEVDNELMLVKSYSTADNTVTLQPFGRGQLGSAKVIHAVGAPVVMAPSWPRAVIAREINNSIRALYPTLFAIKEMPSFTMSPTLQQFVTPADLEHVVDVRYYDSAALEWRRARSWEMDHSMPATAFASGKMLNLWDPIWSGQDVRVIYAARPAPLVAMTDSYETVAGMETQTKDLVILSVIARMMQFAEISRIPVKSVNANTASPNNPVGTASQIARDLRTQYTARLAEEQRAQAVKYPPRVHRTR